MGKVFSVVGSRIRRQINRFNVENRAHKIISQEKPIPAPKHEATQREMEMLMSEYGEEFENMKKKDLHLHERLKNVYVVSKDPNPVNRNYGRPSDKSRLPTNRTSNIESELGYMEPLQVPQGKITLKEAMKLLADHQTDPKAFSVSRISDEYKLSISDTENILKYFLTFHVYIPDKRPELKSNNSILRALKPNDPNVEIPKEVK